jgi:adenine phosphoribosyltransferase
LRRGARKEQAAVVIDDLKQRIRDIPDFPKAGILFRDITPLLADGRAFHQTIDFLGERYLDRKVDVVVGIEARGFIMGSALAYNLRAGNVLIRKPGKLPYKTNRTTYALEYGTDTLEIHQDAIKPGQRVVIADDLLATGGTIGAAAELVRQQGGEIIELAFLIELTALKGRERLMGLPVFSLIQY